MDGPKADKSLDASQSASAALEDQEERPHVHYALDIDTEEALRQDVIHPDAVSDLDDTSRPFSPVMRHRTTRLSNHRAADLSDYSVLRPGWQPGSEPGYDPTKVDGGHASVPTLSAPCEITVIDYSQDKVDMSSYDNAGFISFLNKPQPDWSRCRWINVNGLSWDVIQAVGQHKRLHKLALEDIMNTRNRTKCDWYPNHAFMILTLQKIISLRDGDDSDGNSIFTGRSAKGLVRRMTNKLSGGGSKARVRAAEDAAYAERYGNYGFDGQQRHCQPADLLLVRTLQRYHSSPNEVRTRYMEKHSSLAARGLAVCAEQVAIFLTSDNTVISFFELSAEDIERPLLKRIATPGTILRESCDASILVQGVMDAIIDLAIPVTALYSDVIGDLELDVLTNPSVEQTRSLYIIISEINKMLSFLNPIDNIVNVLKDHKTTLSQEQAARELRNPASGVIITPMTHVYLGDVLDHCIMIVESMNQMKSSADNLISLIFNTISASQNETMRILTNATILFLPLTFLTGYFGMNINPFPELTKGTSYFWTIAIPTMIATLVVLMSNMIRQWVTMLVQRRSIISWRKDWAKLKLGKQN